MQVRANGLLIEVDVQGPPEGEPLLLIMGLGMQLTAWPEPLVQQLAARDRRVIRMDNRDAGLSQGFDHAGVPHVAWAAMRHALHLPVRSAYTIADMAGDAVGVLDALGIERAHIVGASLGGMVAQHVAARFASRVSRLTLLMTTSGARHLPRPAWRVTAALLSRPRIAADATEAAVDRLERVFDAIGSPIYAPATPQARALRRSVLHASVQRAWRPAGVARQLVAVAADGDRSPLLSRITAPTLVVHGTADPLVPVAAAHDLHAKIGGSTLALIEGMGHDLPQPLWPRLASLIAGDDHQPPASAR